MTSVHARGVGPTATTVAELCESIGRETLLSGTNSGRVLGLGGGGVAGLALATRQPFDRAHRRSWRAGHQDADQGDPAWLAHPVDSSREFQVSTMTATEAAVAVEV
jgi:hypothetical protein